MSDDGVTMLGPLALEVILKQIRHTESTLDLLKALRRNVPAFAGYEQTPDREHPLDDSRHRFVLTGATPDSVEATLEVPLWMDPLLLSADALAQAAATQFRQLPQRPGYLTIKFYVRQSAPNSYD